MPRRLTAAEKREEARLELERRDAEDRAAALDAFTAPAIAAGHEPQLALMEDEALNVIALCSRRAGKSNAWCGLLALDAIRFPGETQLYFGRAKPAVRLSIWSKIWKPLCAKWKLPVKHNESTMVSTFDNDSIVAFTGSDDVAHVESYLGNKLRRAVVDEAQSQPDSVLRPLLLTILPPALSDDGGQLAVSGTIPDTPAGLFYEIWSEGEGWAKHNWSRFQNPHLKNQEERLASYMRTSGLLIDDPIIRRDWFGEFVFSENATAYRYLASRNQYSPSLERSDAFKPGELLIATSLPPDLEFFSIAADPAATHDRFAEVVWGWSSKARDVWQVAEWVTPKAANALQSQWMAIMAELTRRFPKMCRWYYDAGSSQTTIDTVQRDYGIPVILPANKASLKGQVDRFADLLGCGRAHVIAGSKLEEDLLKCRWDPDARAKGLWRWSSTWHGDVADAARYALQGYFDITQPEAPPRTPEALEALAMREVFTPRASAEAWQTQDAGLQALWFGQDGGDPG